MNQYLCQKMNSEQQSGENNVTVVVLMEYCGFKIHNFN